MAENDDILSIRQLIHSPDSYGTNLVRQILWWFNNALCYWHPIL